MAVGLQAKVRERGLGLQSRLYECTPVLSVLRSVTAATVCGLLRYTNAMLFLPFLPLHLEKYEVSKVMFCTICTCFRCYCLVPRCGKF